MKAIIFLVMALLSVSLVAADPISIYTFNYDNGKITLIAQENKEGFVPDRLLQPEEGYRCALQDNEEDLYSFKFEIPLRLITEIAGEEKIESEVIILTETDFSLLMPYIQEAEDIACYNPSGFEILREDVEKIQEDTDQRNTVIGYIILAIIGLIILIRWQRRKR